MSASIRKEIRWHDRMEARVAAGILLLVTLSLAAVVFAATRVSTRSAVARAAYNLEGARSAFYRLVDETQDNLQLFATTPLAPASALPQEPIPPRQPAIDALIGPLALPPDPGRKAPG